MQENINVATFSISPKEEQQWKKNLEDYFNGKLTNTQIPIKISSAPSVLQALGFANRDIMVSHHAIEKMYKYGKGYPDAAKHTLDYHHLENLSAAINNPILTNGQHTCEMAKIPIG